MYLFFYCNTTEAYCPGDVQGYNTSSTSIFIQWRNDTGADQNFTMQSYTVIYKILPDGDPKTKTVSAPATQATLRGLNKYTN